MNNQEKEFLISGVVEDYCLGTASPEDVVKLMELCARCPEAKAYLKKNEKGMESFIGGFSKKPSERSKSIIRNHILDNLKLEKTKLIGTDQMLPEFIGISRHSKIEHWDALLNGIEPPAEFDNIFVKPLFDSPKRKLTLVWAKDLVPDEVHDDMNESFLLLEGTVDCYINDEVFSMVRGDFMDIPLHSVHKVVVTSSTTGKAIRSEVLL